MNVNGRPKLSAEEKSKRDKKVSRPKPIESPESIAARIRFNQAIQFILDKKLAPSVMEITLKLGLRYTTLARFKVEPEKNRLDIQYYTKLVEVYNISPLWLLTGRGPVWMNGEE